MIAWGTHAGAEVFPVSIFSGDREHLKKCFRTFLCMLGVLLGISCSGPGSYEEFVRAEDAAGGVYEFAFPGVTTVIPSSTVIPSEAKESPAFDLSFYTAPLAEPLQLQITLDSLSETVWFPVGQNKALYRSGIRLTGAETVLRVRPVNPPEEFRGLGIIIKRNDGTR